MHTVRNLPWWTLYSSALNDFRHFRCELLNRKWKSLKYCLLSLLEIVRSRTFSCPKITADKPSSTKWDYRIFQQNDASVKSCRNKTQLRGTTTGGMREREMTGVNLVSCPCIIAASAPRSLIMTCYHRLFSQAPRQQSFLILLLTHNFFSFFSRKRIFTQVAKTPEWVGGNQRSVQGWGLLSTQSRSFTKKTPPICIANFPLVSLWTPVPITGHSPQPSPCSIRPNPGSFPVHSNSSHR